MKDTKSKMRINIYLKNGPALTLKCDKFTIHRNGLGNFTGYTCEGADLPRPMYIDCEQIVAIERDVDAD